MGEKSEIILYQPDSSLRLELRKENETLWLTQKQISELFQTTVPNINLHLKNIFDEKELSEEATIKDFLIVRQEGNRQVERLQKHYNLDAILSVGYRIAPKIATEFRQWVVAQQTNLMTISDIQSIDLQENTDVVFYTGPDGKFRIELAYDGDTFWTTQKRMGEIFDVDVRTISYHLTEIFDSNELNKYSVIRKIWITADDGKRYDTMIYNLDAIIAVGYRVNSVKATHFRVWATQILSEFIRTGFVIDDERFKQGGKWSAEHFDLVLERVRDIRASERMLYQKVTDIYATSDDYLKDSPVTRSFYAKVQNKLHWAIAGRTAAEIIYHSADATKQNMGLTTWKLAPKGKIMKSDVDVAKNYLSEEHLKELNQIVSAYLDLAENRAKRRLTTTMQDWAMFLDSFLELSSYPILLDGGKISAQEAKIKAFEEYNKFSVVQDRNYISDFDRMMEEFSLMENNVEK